MNKAFGPFFYVLFSAILLMASSACHPKAGSNPYLHMKERPSEKQIHADQKVIKRGNKHYAKKEDSSMHHLFGRGHKRLARPAK